MQSMRGKAVKVVSSLLYYMPLSLPYKVIFIRRDFSEILAPQKKYLTVEAKIQPSSQTMFSDSR
ncbi:hypothetical protein U27_00072 [Candidatus Vecturithrix granuli]|uniref:Uncharacterized protein n=1 Tax=Vecturithrix granuli TaxID=1499967 RepID=A0A081C6H6_VECG1|nr:hypothetical protein U27_00072 [Candidatus Vecturithrix granuli]